MAKRNLTEREKKILEQIGSTEEAQRSKQIVELYRRKDEADRAYADAQKKASGFAGSGLDFDRKFSSDAVNADLLAKKKEADAAVAAFEQSNADRNFRQRASRLTMKQFEQEFADIERRKQELEESKGSFWEALKPGGVTPSEWNASRKEKNAQIKALENEEDKYRAIRDDKKSHYETDMLPDDIKALLDGYNAVDISDEGIDLQNMFLPAEQKSHTRINSQKLKNEQKRREIADELVKRGYDNYKELAEYRKYVRESEATDKVTEEMGKFSEAHPIASTAGNVALMPARLMMGAMGTLKGATDDKETDLSVNPKSTYYALTRANKEKRETIGESFEDGVLSANTKKFLYETADSALESLAAGAMFGPAGGAMLGLGAMNESVIESLESGRTSTEALVNGIAAGAFEMIFESLSLGKIKALKDVPVKTIKDVVKNIGKSVLVNFSEEANTEIANLIFDTIYNGGTSQYYEAVTALMGQGYSEKEARSRVIKDMAKQVGLAGLGGALMGSAFGAYGSAAGAVNYNSQLQDTGRQIVDYDNAESLVAGAKDVQGNDKLRQLAEDIVFTERAQQKAELEGKIAGLKEELAGITDEKVVKDKKKELRTLEKEVQSIYTKKDYRNVGKASEILAEQTSADADTVIKDSVVKRLEALGETGDIQLKAEAITRTMRNKKLKGSQKSALEQGKYTQRVLNELQDSSGEFSSEWAEKASADIDSLYDRRYNPKLAKSAEPTAPAENEAVVQSKPQTKEYEQKVDNVKVQLKDALLRDGQDKDVLSAAVDLCFEYGRNGGYTLQDAVGSRAISEKIAPEQRKHAYEAGVYQGLKDTANVRYKGDTVSVFVNGFTGKDNISRKSYASAFDVFYSEGAHTAKSFDEALKANSSLLSYIGNGVAQQAFEQGRKFAETESTAPAVSRKKPVVLGGYKSKTLEEKEVDVFFESLAKKLGVNITRVQSINAKNGRRANAYVDINKGEVVSSASSDNEYQSTIHESVHIAYAYNAEKMRPVAKAVKEFFISKHSAVRLEETLRSYEQNYEGDRAAAEEEFIADCIAGMFSTDEGVNDFLSWLEKDSGYNAEEKKTILQKLSDWILEIIDAIEELMQGKSLNDVAAEFAKEETARFKEIRQMFLEALDEVADGTAEGETKNTAEGGVKYSIAYDSSGGYVHIDTDQNLFDNKSVPEMQNIARNVIKSKFKGHVFNVGENGKAFVNTRSSDEYAYPANRRMSDELKEAKMRASTELDNLLEVSSFLEHQKDDGSHPQATGGWDVYKTRFEVLGNMFSGEVKIMITDRGYVFYDVTQIKRLPVNGGQPKYSLGATSGNLSNNNIPQNDNVVNSQDMQSSEKKFSYAENDNKYLEAVESGDTETAQKMVDEAAKSKGYDSPILYHGTHSFGFTSFDLDKMDDKRSIFLTSNEKIASTYSGVTGTKNIGKGKSLNVADMSAGEIVKALNEYDAKHKEGTTEGPHKYELYDYGKTNKLINNVNEGIENLKTTVNNEIKNYAEKMAVDFDEKDSKIHRQLVSLEERLDRYDYHNLSTPIYLLLHHSDVFKGSAEIAELEKNIRLMNQVRTKDLSAGVVVNEALGGYVIEVMEVDQAREYLDNRLKAGNYSLYAKLGKSLIIDGKGALWKDIRNWSAALEVKASDVDIIKKGDFYELVDSNTQDIIEGGSFAVNTYTDELYQNNKARLRALMVSNANSILHINTETLNTTRDIAKYAKKHGYDSVLFKNILDNGGWNSEVDYDELADIYVIFDESAVKSADAVTYDENGKVIPLSERFKDDNKDIRFSYKPSLDWIDFAEEKARERSLVSEITELKKINEELRGKIQHPGVKHILSKVGVQNVARYLKSEYMSKINVHVLSDELGTLYGYLANENGLNWDNVQIHLESIATKILDESKYKNPDISEYSKDILREIRSVKIQLNDKQKNAVANKYGSYNEFRKKTMGTLVLSNEGMSLDQRWGELCDKYPMFDRNTSDADQPIVLMDIVASLRQTYEDPYGMDYDSAKEMLMTEIYEQYFEVPETKYISEEYALKLARAKADYGERLNEAKTEFRSQRDEAYKKAKAEYGEALKDIREEQQEEIIKAKARYNLRVQNIADTRTKEKKRNNIIRNVKRLDKLLRNPGKGAPSAGTNKYGKDYVHLTNIPQEFRKAVIDFCSIFIENDAGVFSGIVKSDNVTVREKKVEHLQKIYAMMQNSESYLSETVAEEMQERIDTVAKIMAERRLAQLSIEELDKVIEITEYLTASINSQVAVWVEGKKSTVEAEGKAAIDRFNAMGRNTYIGGEIYHIGKALGVNNYKPVYFFERVGGVLEKLFLTIQNDGQRAYARNINAAVAFMEGINKKYNYQKWQKEKELVLTTKQGHKLKLTKAQAMHIWATAERERIAGKDAMHLMQGGIVFDGEIEADTVEVKDKKTGKKKTELTKKVFKYKTEDGSAHRIHFEDVMKISEYLTTEQKAFVNECIRYLSVDMAALGNEISMELYGIRRFNEQYYIPYNSAKNFIYRKMGENGNAMLKNKSFTKETVFGANNPLVVGDFLEVVAKHIEEMSMYNAMVLPLDNFNRVWNYKTIAPEDDPTKSGQSVKSAMETAFGKEYVAYVEQLLEDINGGINTDARQKALVKLTSRFKKTAVLASASVVIQQPSAVVRAFAEIDPKYFVSTTFAGRKKAWENALKYSSTALLKDIGGFDTVSGQNTVDYLTKEEYKGKDKVLKLFTDSQYRDDILAWGPAFADKVTWAHIWAACEREVRTKQRGLSGEAFYEAVGKRFDEVVNKTQVYDSVLARSSNMRSKDSLMQMATSFMAEPTTQANMLASAVFDLKNKDVKKGIKKAGSVALSQLFNAVLVSMIYAARDDDEEKTLVEKYISEVVNNFLGSLNPLTLVPVYKDVMSLLEGYDVKRTDMSLASKIADAIKALSSTSKTRGEKILTFAGSAVDLTGFPLSNLIRDGLAVKNVISSAKGVKDTTEKGITYAIQDDMLPVLQNMKWYKPDGKDERLYYAFRDNDEKMYNRLASQYKTGGAIKSALKKQIEENYLEEKLTDEEAMAQLRRLGFSENEAYYEVRKLKEPVAEEESEDSNAAFKSFSEMQTIQSEADAELEAERKEAKDEGETYSEDADYTWLRDKLKAGDKQAIAEEIDLLTEKGVSKDKISEEVRKWLKDNDADVQSQAEQSLKGNYSSYESTVKRIADKYGIDESTAASAIRSAAGSSSDTVEGTVYALGDMHFAIDKGSEQTISDISKQIFNAKLKLKLNEGEEYDKAYSSVRSGMRSSITSKWKEAYIAGNSSEKAQIRRQIWFTRLWDTSYDLDKTLNGWLDG